MLLQLLISDLISNLASVFFFIPGKHFVYSHVPYVYLATPMQRFILKLYSVCEYLNRNTQLDIRLQSKVSKIMSVQSFNHSLF